MEDFQKKARYYVTWGYPKWNFQIFLEIPLFLSLQVLCFVDEPRAILPRRRKKLLCSGVLLPTRQRNKAYWQKNKPRRQEMMPPMRIWLPTRPNTNTGFCTWPIMPCRRFFQKNAQMPHEFGAS